MYCAKYLHTHKYFTISALSWYFVDVLLAIDNIMNMEKLSLHTYSELFFHQLIIARTFMCRFVCILERGFQCIS